MEEGIRYEVKEDIAVITLDSPPLNILTASRMDAISSHLEGVAADSTLKGVLFQANGRAFSAGADVEEHRPEKVEAMIGSFGRMFRGLDACELPVVAAVSGAALGGGFELAMMADVLLAGEEATFGQPEIRLGFFAPVGVIRLPALVGPARAMEIVCSGRTYTAAEMLSYGLVTRVVPAAALDGVVEEVLRDFRRSSPLIMRMNVRVLKRLRGRSFVQELEEANQVFCRDLMKTEDVREGLASFFEKRRPVWKNR
jgi:cyclohexa-1,5-dienecarbonyl-CoA hydratase